MPNIFENRIFLPPSYLDWTIRQPPGILTGTEAVAEKVESLYTMRQDYKERTPGLHGIVQRQVKLHLDDLTLDLMDEISFSMDKLLGLDTNRYQTVNINKAVKL